MDDAGDTVAQGSSAALEYARRVHADVREQNKELYTRAQVILTLDGILVAAVGASLATQPDDLSKTLAVFGASSWFALGLAGAALVASVLCSVMTLYARHFQGIAPPLGDAGYEPPTMWFFRHIAELEPSRFIDRAAQADVAFETRAHLAQVATVAPIMVRRAAWLNGAFACTGLALVSFAVAIADYLIRLNS
jgi:hypothetical protein